MTTNDRSDLDPAFAAFAAKLELYLGPEFDPEDVRAVLGTDVTLIHASDTAHRFESAKSAAASAVRSLSAHWDGLQRARGVIACVTVGTAASALAAMRAVMTLLRLEVPEDTGVICSTCVDPAMDKDINVMLWAR